MCNFIFPELHVIILRLAVSQSTTRVRTERVELEVTGDVRVTETGDGVPT